MIIYPEKINSFQNLDRTQRNFVLLVNSIVDPFLNISELSGYKSVEKRVSEEYHSPQFEENTDYLVVMYPKSDEPAYYRLKRPEEMAPTSRSIRVPLRSTHSNVEDIPHYIEFLYKHDAKIYEKKVTDFFSSLEKSEKIVFTNERHGTSFEYKFRKGEERNKEKWLEMGGYCGLGSFMPGLMGEIEVSPNPVDFSDYVENQTTLIVNGSVVVDGPIILNSGYLPSTKESQMHIYNELATISLERPVIFEIENGLIDRIFSIDGQPHRAVDMLHKMCEIDGRYKILYELGISINPGFTFLDGNQIYNEKVDVSKDGSGTLHIGLGLLNRTQFHIDMVCLGTKFNFST